MPSAITAIDAGVAAVHDSELEISQATGNFTTATSSTMNSSQISTNYMQTAQCSASGVISGSINNPTSDSNTSGAHNAIGSNGKHIGTYNISGKSCRFPKLEECAHFHYERVQLGPLSVRLLDDKSEFLNSSIASQSIGGDIANFQNVSAVNRSFSPANCWFILKVLPHQCDPFLVKRSFENVKMLDEMLHRCVYDRKISGLKNLEELDFKSEEDVEYAVGKYLERFSKIASDSLTCGTILTWLQLDNKGRRLPLADGETQRTINTPAVGAAYGVRRYQAQAADEISIEVGDMISVIDMPTPAESIWWRGKKSHLQKSQYEVGFFPQSCVATIGDKVPRHFPMPAPLVGQLDVSPTKPVLRKHGKLIAFFRSFILSRPSRRRLKQSGIYRERVFSCDLSEHLLNSGQDIPMVLKCCAEFIEENGIVDGIYRLSGITSNIQRLRRAFDEERVPDLANPEIKQDIHAVSSLLKMYFRELPNPLCTYQLYDNFVEAIQAKSESNDRLRLMKETVLKLPPPHYRTLKYLSEHLNKISQHSAQTGMTDKNLAIVWAPNLLRSPALETGGVAALRGVGVQAVVTEYLIRNCHNIFDALEECNARLSFFAMAGASAGPELRLDSLTDCESLLVDQREHDQSLPLVERPKSLSAAGPKLISLEEAQERHSRVDGFDIKHSIAINMVPSNTTNIGSYIEVGGGPSSLPDKYHTVITVPRNWQKRKTHSWKSLFTRNQQRPITENEIRGSSGKTFSNDIIPLEHKGTTQVTFANAASVIGTKTKGNKSSLLNQEKTKSIEQFEMVRESINSIKVCVRSNSIDSLRTSGHSRSVSHDSYFDLLQSPQRAHHAIYQTSRELSELGLNFDREEPEMKIFSESESLVSSPRVGKENIPPLSSLATRKILRARPEEFSSQTNSVNPSPKKQPRLNILMSPTSAETVDIGTCHETLCNESFCKRYKIEDQLSDIQYIDCATPENVISNSSTLLTSVQVHPPPKSSISKSSLHRSTDAVNQTQDLGATEEQSPHKTGIFINTRYSYPSVQFLSQPSDKGQLNMKERSSYPGVSLGYPKKDRIVSQMQGDSFKANLLKGSTTDQKSVSSSSNSISLAESSKLRQRCTSNEFSHLKNQKNCYDSNDTLNKKILRTSSVDMPKDPKAGSLDCSRLSVTPISPVQSPRYSLLVGDTSSENSSTANTPQFEIDPLMVGSGTSEISTISGNFSNQLNYRTDTASGYLQSSRENFDNNTISQSDNNSTEIRDISVLKRDLCLDLKPYNGKNCADQPLHDNSSNVISLNNKQHLSYSPNNSNVTDNTSQSITPSEFGYQYLQRQLSMHSLLETEENSVGIEDYGNTASTSISPLSNTGISNNKTSSPIKSTISITYNLKSPDKPPAQNEIKVPTSKTLLETTFDESTVYEQVKLLRDSVTMVNKLLTDDRKSSDSTNLTAHKNVSSESGKDFCYSSIGDNRLKNSKLQQDGFVAVAKALDSCKNNIYDDHLPEESLKVKKDDESMYQNVLLKKPKSVYENIKGENMKDDSLKKSKSEKEIFVETQEKLDVDSLDSIEEVSAEQSKCAELENLEFLDRKSPSNLSVKALANKFENSPVEQMSAFDFNVRNSIKKVNTSSANLILPVTKTAQSSVSVDMKPLPTYSSSGQTSTDQLQQKLTKSQQITRSLDENAFIREFGAKHLEDLNARNSQKQLREVNELSNRRKSFDFTRPKTLNPPKRLPGFSIAEEETKNITPAVEDKTENYYNTLNSNSSNPSFFYEHDFESAELKVVPAKEDRLSFLQSKGLPSSSTNDLGNSNLSHFTNSSKVLSGVKLDRERIDKIKEERRLQLTQLYHTDSLKSRSKTDLNSSSKEDDNNFHAESLRVKSKSRGDIRFLQKDIDNLKELSRSAASMLAGSESLLISPTFTDHRGRSISDEKNQNSNKISAIVATIPIVLVRTASSNVVADNETSSISKKLTSASNVIEGSSARTKALKFEKKAVDLGNTSSGTREWTPRANVDSSNIVFSTNRSSLTAAKEKISPQFSIRDVTAMFESRSQNHQ